MTSEAHKKGDIVFYVEESAEGGFVARADPDGSGTWPRHDSQKDALHPASQVDIVASKPTTGRTAGKNRLKMAGGNFSTCSRNMACEPDHLMPMCVRRHFLLAALVLAAPIPSMGAEESPQELFGEAVRLFFEAKPVESARVFDRLVVAVPGAEPELWQRGLALYYAERYQDGRRQFELHKTVNPNDVENPAWHFLCVARLQGAEAARKALLSVGEDSRVPMAEILALYAGRGTESAVLEAAKKGEGETRKNQLNYAHLYLGLYAEALGDAKKAKHHINQAAGPFRMGHYMGEVAVMHAKLRGWPVEE
jgi:hypothetical protein